MVLSFEEAHELTPPLPSLNFKVKSDLPESRAQRAQNFEGYERANFEFSRALARFRRGLPRKRLASPEQVLELVDRGNVRGGFHPENPNVDAFPNDSSSESVCCAPRARSIFFSSSSTGEFSLRRMLSFVWEADTLVTYRRALLIVRAKEPT